MNERNAAGFKDVKIGRTYKDSKLREEIRAFNGKKEMRAKEAYSEEVLVRCDRLASQRTEIRLRKQAANLGYQLTPVPEPGI